MEERTTFPLTSRSRGSAIIALKSSASVGFDPNPSRRRKKFRDTRDLADFSFRYKKKNLLLHFYKGHLQKKPVLVLFQNMEKSSVICKTVKDLSGMLKSIYIHLCYPKHAGFFGLRAWALAFGILVSRMKNFRLPNL